METIKVTKEDMYNFISDDSEWAEILSDLINGDYTVEALRQDLIESQEQGN